ncbi:MAG: YchJ family protein [Deltaproteobacteria bacterium]|nr:YchJ family protein [Deltaproteobacteria bacterium]
MNSCPCGSGATYSDCCEPFITGALPAKTAEQLMRARYSAFVGAQMDFIFDTTHPDHRKGYDHAGTREWAENSEWHGLEIIDTIKGGVDDIVGQVEFIARFSEKGEQREHHENAQFVRENGNWFFSEGSMVKPRPVTVNKVGRNDPCICGSGVKYKKCCGR